MHKSCITNLSLPGIYYILVDDQPTNSQISLTKHQNRISHETQYTSHLPTRKTRYISLSAHQ